MFIMIPKTMQHHHYLCNIYIVLDIKSKLEVSESTCENIGKFCCKYNASLYNRSEHLKIIIFKGALAPGICRDNCTCYHKIMDH